MSYFIKKYGVDIRKEKMDNIISGINKTLDENLKEEEKFIGFIQEILKLYVENLTADFREKDCQ